ncbi:hypothetical protein D041_3857A, partial [Vibrio parahaemolyticus EKP-008]
MAIFYVDTFPF